MAVIGLAILVSLAGLSVSTVAADCGVQTATETSSPGCVSLTGSPDGSTALTGTGSRDTPAFYLPPGGNTLTWTATAPEGDIVNFAGFIKPLDPNQPGWMFVANVVLKPSETQSGSVDVPSTSFGAFYLTTIGNSKWTVNITRVRLDTILSSGAQTGNVTTLPVVPASFAPGGSTPRTAPTVAPVPIPVRPRLITPRPTRTPRPRTSRVYPTPTYPSYP